MSHQVYARTTGGRTQQYSSLRFESTIVPNQSSRVSSPHSYVTGSSDARSPLHPTSSQLRDARLQKFQGTYNEAKEVFKTKEEEKRRNKLEDKLKRYRGVGVLGNKMVEGTVSDQLKSLDLSQSRNNFQLQYDNNSRMQSQRTREIKNREASHNQATTDPGCIKSALSGSRLGGNSVDRVRGEHPLFARLQNGNQEQDSSQ